MNSELSIGARAEKLTSLLQTSQVTDNSKGIIEINQGIALLCDRLDRLRNANQALFVLGNGGSAGVASHAVTDFFNVGGLRATTLHESSLLTCMSNDYGYENAYARMIAQMARADDMLIAISSSGQSMNIRNAAEQATQVGASVVTLSGFNTNNPLRELGDTNFWVDSQDYGLVEIGHQFILHNIADRLQHRLRASS